jgi:hypothetical protein
MWGSELITIYPRVYGSKENAVEEKSTTAHNALSLNTTDNDPGLTESFFASTELHDMHRGLIFFN